MKCLHAGRTFQYCACENFSDLISGATPLRSLLDYRGPEHEVEAAFQALKGSWPRVPLVLPCPPFSRRTHSASKVRVTGARTSIRRASCCALCRGGTLDMTENPSLQRTKAKLGVYISNIIKFGARAKIITSQTRSHKPQCQWTILKRMTSSLRRYSFLVTQCSTIILNVVLYAVMS